MWISKVALSSQALISQYSVLGHFFPLIMSSRDVTADGLQVTVTMGNLSVAFKNCQGLG